MADIALSLDNVIKRYGSVAAVSGVSFDVRQGEMFGLIGPDGAGKTTTIRAAAAACSTPTAARSASWATIRLREHAAITRDRSAISRSASASTAI